MWAAGHNCHAADRRSPLCLSDWSNALLVCIGGSPWIVTNNSTDSFTQPFRGGFEWTKYRERRGTGDNVLQLLCGVEVVEHLDNIHVIVRERHVSKQSVLFCFSKGTMKIVAVVGSKPAETLALK